MTCPVLHHQPAFIVEFPRHRCGRTKRVWKRVRSVSPHFQPRCFLEVSKASENSHLCTQFSHAVLGCIPIPPTSWHWCQAAMRRHFSQDRLMYDNHAMCLQRPYTYFRTSPSQQNTPACYPAAHVCSQCSSISARCSLSMISEMGLFKRELTIGSLSL